MTPAFSLKLTKAEYAILKKGIDLANAGKLRKAKKVFKRIHREENDHLKLHAISGLVHLNAVLKKTQELRSNLDRLAELNQGKLTHNLRWFTSYYTAIFYTQKEMYKAALIEMRRAIRTDPAIRYLIEEEQEKFFGGFARLPDKSRDKLEFLKLIDVMDDDSDLQQLIDRECKKQEAKGRLILLEFHADWCPPCKDMREILSSEKARKALRHFKRIRIDVGHFDSYTRVFFDYTDNRSIPALVVMNPSCSTFYQLKSTSMEGASGDYDEKKVIKQLKKQYRRMRKK